MSRRGWIKLCGLTDEAAVAAALDAGVDAIGFVFAPSVRQVSPERAAQLARPARGRVECIAVMRHPEQAQVDEVLKLFAPDALQTDVGDFDSLNLPATLPRLAVLRAGSGVPVPNGLPRMLFEGLRSGSGEVADWQEAARHARNTALVLAGGLDADNVAAAIAAVRPHGVDSSSGVEARPGLKSPGKIARFVAAAREAFSEVERV
jgi:phosphoribosylanthranilate isomerase